MKKTNNIIIISLITMILLKLTNSKIYLIYNNLINYVTILLVIISSIYFNIKLKFKNYNIIKIIKEIKSCTKEDIKSLLTSMGAKIGIGSIAGTSIAIYLYGPGVLLWIWIISILSSVLTYCETYLGSIYNHKGVINYIKNGLKNNTLAKIYTLLLIITYELGFIGIQTNTMYKTICKLNFINNNTVIVFIITVVALLLFNKLKNIINIISQIVPVMCLTYLLICIPLLLKINIINTLKIIIKDGFNNNIIPKIIIGMQRGIFATESGTGTSSITTTLSNSTPEKQGLYQVLGVHFIIIFIITITGLIITTNQNQYIGRINGIEIIINIFKNNYGTIGSILITVIISLFAISTILSSYYYISNSINYFQKNKKTSRNIIIKITIIIIGYIGIKIKSSIIWSLIDNFIMFLLTINIITMIKLKKEIK